MKNTTENLLDAFIEAVAQRVAEKLGAAAENNAREKDLYTVDDLAERYSLSKDAVRDRVRAGEFGEVVRFGNRCYRVTADGVRQYEEAHLAPAYTARAAQAPAAGRRSKARRDPGPI